MVRTLRRRISSAAPEMADGLPRGLHVMRAFRSRSEVRTCPLAVSCERVAYGAATIGTT
jgi:hypothetical protein